MVDVRAALRKTKQLLTLVPPRSRPLFRVGGGMIFWFCPTPRTCFFSAVGCLPACLPACLPQSFHCDVALPELLGKHGQSAVFLFLAHVFVPGPFCSRRFVFWRYISSLVSVGLDRRGSVATAGDVGERV